MDRRVICVYEIYVATEWWLPPNLFHPPRPRFCGVRAVGVVHSKQAQPPVGKRQRLRGLGVDNGTQNLVAILPTNHVLDTCARQFVNSTLLKKPNKRQPVF